MIHSNSFSDHLKLNYYVTSCCYELIRCNKSVVFNFPWNYDCPKETVFVFPNEKKYYNKQQWIRFVNREGWKLSKKSCICREYFELHYYKTRAQGKQYRLLKIAYHFWSKGESFVSRIQTFNCQNHQQRVYQQDQFKLFEEQYKIKSFDDVDYTLTPPGYTFQKYDNYFVFYYLKNNVLKLKRNNLLNYRPSYFQVFNTMVLKIQFHLKVAKFLGNYFTMFLKKITCLRLTWEKLQR